MAWLPRGRPWSLFIASANGYLDCFSFDDADFDNHVRADTSFPLAGILTRTFHLCNRPRNAAVKVPGLITCLSINDDNSQIAASYDHTTKIFTLPLNGTLTPCDGDASLTFLILWNFRRAARIWGQSWIPDKPRVPSCPGRTCTEAPKGSWPALYGYIHPLRRFLFKHQASICLRLPRRASVLMSVLSRAYDTDPASPTKGVLWEIAVPDTTNMSVLPPSSQKLS